VVLLAIHRSGSSSELPTHRCPISPRSLLEWEPSSTPIVAAVHTEPPACLNQRRTERLYGRPAGTTLLEYVEDELESTMTSPRMSGITDR